MDLVRKGLKSDALTMGDRVMKLGTNRTMGMLERSNFDRKDI